MVLHSEKPRKVAAYCRVSTDKDDQINSLESQKKYFREYIERNPHWELAEVYVDEGITGTSTKKRHAFNRMMADACRNAFDLIITKEISRFARNTLDSILYTRKLKELGVGVIFMNDNINTLDSDAELRLTIMSSIAQEESRKTSDRVKWGQKRRMEQGVVFGRDMLGYDMRGGKLYINEGGAEIVRLIFYKFINEGKGTHVIARELREAGIQTATHMKQWSNTVILRVLRNEKYCGDLIQKKTFTPDYLNHEKKPNRGEEELVVLREHHEPIISRALFEKAQAELARRSPSAESKKKYSNRYCFSGKIKCGICGASFVSRSKKRKDGSVYQTWRCFENSRNGKAHIDRAGERAGCSNSPLNNEDVKWMTQYILSNLDESIPKVVENLREIIADILCCGNKKDNAASRTAQLEGVRDKKQRLLELYMEQGITKQEFKSMNAKYDAAVAMLEQDIETYHAQEQMRKSQDELMSEINTALCEVSGGREWNTAFCRHLLEGVTVREDGIIEVRLKFLPVTWQFCHEPQV